MITTSRTITTQVLNRFSVKWWDITGEVSDEELIEAAEERIKDLIVQGYTCGQLYHNNGESAATGWWE
jgi:hypothetical protein